MSSRGLARREAVKLDPDLRLNEHGEELATQHVYPTLELSDRKRAEKFGICRMYLGNVLYRHRAGKVVMATRNTTALKNHRVHLTAVDALVAAGWLDEKRGCYDVDTGRGWLSRYWPSDKLLQVFAGAARQDGLVERTPSALIVLKDKDKRVVPMPDNLDERAREYFNRCEQHIAKLNRVNRRHVFRYRVWNDVKGCLSDQVCPTFSSLKAVYNNLDFRQGGRLYSEYQNLRKKERATLLIDGQPTVELDYGCLHPAMLYNERGLPLPDDAYSVFPNQNETLRDAIKIALSALLNTTKDSAALTERAALSACNLALSDRDRSGRIKPQREVEVARRLKRELRRRRLSFKGIIRAVKAKHRPIRKCFGTGVGLRLQNDDVKLVYRVCLHFCNQGIPILPIHDSFIVETKYEPELRKVMGEAYHDTYGFNPTIRDTSTAEGPAAANR